MDSMLNSETSWGDAIKELAALPPSLMEDYGEVNFLCSMRYRRNARRLFEEGILPLVASGREFEVVTGYVDSAAHEALEAVGETAAEGAGEFLHAKLRDVATGELVEVSI
jgi:hypothetical protein